MKNYFATSLGRLRLVAFLEGVSFLVLLLIAMPLKYMAGMPEMVKITGMAHGILFILYILAVFQIREEMGWNWKNILVALAASVIPLGTFYADSKLFKPAQA